MRNILWLLAVIFALFGCKAEADPFRFPNRSFEGSIVNLTPLFKWWQTSPPPSRFAGRAARLLTPETNSMPRPLTSWKLIRGKVVEVRPYSFIVDAMVYTNDVQYEKVRIYLYRAPLPEKTEFETLMAERDRLNQSKTDAYAAYKSSKDDAKSAADSAAIIRTVVGPDVDYITNPKHNRYNSYLSTASQADQKANASLNDFNAANDRIAQIDKSLNTISPGNDYIVDWFALDTGKKTQGLPLYDCGVPY